MEILWKSYKCLEKRRIMNYKVIFKRFICDTDNTIVFLDAKTAKAAADAVRHYYCVGSDDILSVTPEK